jgi:hypothetical protein
VWRPFADRYSADHPPGRPALETGLEALTLFLAEGWPPAPWAIDVPVSSFADTFDDDMGYADAFRLWLMCGFDDRPTFETYASTQPLAPSEWVGWMERELHLPGDATEWPPRG